MGVFIVLGFFILVGYLTKLFLEDKQKRRENEKRNTGNSNNNNS